MLRVCTYDPLIENQMGKKMADEGNLGIYRELFSHIQGFSVQGNHNPIRIESCS